MDYLTDNNVFTDEIIDIISDLREYSDDLSPPVRPKTEQSAEIAELTDKFLAAGGVIQQIPYDPTNEIIANREEYTICAALTESLADFPRGSDE